MLLEVKLRLASPVLGALRADKGGIRRFQRNNGKLLVSQFRLEEGLALASSNLNLGGADAFVRMEHTCQPPAIFLYERRFRAGGVLQMEQFEALRKGTVITFKLLLRDDLPKCPSLATVQQLFELVGEFAGMSPFGGKFGMGRFSVEQLSAVSSGSLQAEPALAAAKHG